MPVDVSTSDGAAPWMEAAGDVLGLAEAALKALDRDDAELSILLTDDVQIHALNRDYRDKDSPTDVLSFGQDEGEVFPGMVPVLGDLVISLSCLMSDVSTLVCVAARTPSGSARRAQNAFAHRGASVFFSPFGAWR